jgi:hypothetical protein
VLQWQIGVEIELIAPQGLSRETLAQKFCPPNGKVRRFFHPQSEPSKVPNMPVFENLTLGFEVFDVQGDLIVKCVDDLTLQRDCLTNMPPKSGWYRIVSDDRRLLELVRQQCNASDSIIEVLNPIAQLFRTELQYGEGNMVKAVDSNNLPIAIASPLPGERERPCEIITPPLKQDYLNYLENLLNTALNLGFSIPHEGAIHIHFDAEALADTRVFMNLVNLFWTYGDNLRQLVGSNSNCQRLGKWHISLWELVNDSYFPLLSWQEAKAELMKLPLTKYCDFNLKNIVYSLSDKYTFEVRIFPVWLDAESIIYAGELIQGLLHRAINTEYIDPQPILSWDLKQIQDLLTNLNLEPSTLAFWHKMAIAHNNA